MTIQWKSVFFIKSKTLLFHFFAKLYRKTKVGKISF